MSTGTSLLKKIKEILSVTPHAQSHEPLSRDEHAKIVREAVKKMSPSEPYQSRIQFLREFIEFVKTYKIDDVKSLWAAVQDLISKDQPIDSQEVAYQFLAALIEGQYSSLGLLRITFFRLLQNSSATLPFKIRVLQQLTRHGRDIAPFEQEIGYLLLQWLSSFDSWNVDDLLDFLSLITKYNFSFLEDPAKAGLIKTACDLCNSTTSISTVEKCIIFFDVIVRYGTIPPTCLSSLISSLCRTVNIEKFCKQSWQTMNNILKSHYGNQGIEALCSILCDPTNQYTINLLRGAVFFLGMSVWGSQRISTLHASPSNVLTAFYQVLNSRQNIVAYEVLLALSRLVKKYSNELRIEWDIIVDICQKMKMFLGDQENTSFVNVFGETLSAMTDVLRKESYFGNRAALLQLLEETTRYYQESSVLTLIDEKAKYIQPMCDDWMIHLQTFARVFIQQDPRTKIRLRGLHELIKVHSMYKYLYEDEIIDKVIVPYLSTLSQDTNANFRNECLDYILEMAKNCKSSKFGKLVDIIERAANSHDEIAKRAIAGLISIFKLKFYALPYTHSIYVFNILVRHIYRDSVYVRREVLSCLSDLRADLRYYLMIGDKPSPYLRVIPNRSSSSTRSSIGGTPTPKKALTWGHVPFIDVYNALLYSLQHETNAENYSMVLLGLSKMLRNRYIMYGVDKSKLASLLCGLLEKKRFAEADSTSKKEELYDNGFQLLSLLVGCNAELTIEQQHEIMDTLIMGLCHKWNFSSDAKLKIQKTCLSTLSIAVLEFRVNLNYASTILENVIPQIANIPNLLIQVMEFLILLSKRHRFVQKFSVEVYERVIKLVLPFTDPKKPTSVMAYQVLASWFIASPLTFRPQLFAHISKYLYYFIKEKNDLLAEANIDLFCRFTYSDKDISVVPAKDSSVFDGASRSWCQSNMIVTVKSGKMGWSQVTVRRATGTSVWVMRMQTNAYTEVFSSSMNLQFLNDLNSLPLLRDSSELFETPIQSPESKRPLSPVNAKRPDSPIALVESPKLEAPQYPQDEDKVPESPRAPRPPAQEIEPTLFEHELIEDFDYTLESIRNFAPIIINIPGQKEAESASNSFVEEPLISVSLSSTSTDSFSLTEKSPASVSLFAFYPPLPSYEAEKLDDHSPSLMKAIEDPVASPLLDVQHCKLSLDAQMLLHSSKSLSDSEMHLTPSSNNVELNSFKEIHLDNSPALSPVILLRKSDSFMNDSKSPTAINTTANITTIMTPSSSGQLNVSSTSPPKERSNAIQKYTQFNLRSPSMSYDNLTASGSSLNSTLNVNKSVDPNLIYLQMQQIPMTDTKQKVLKTGDGGLDRALTVLDRTLYKETIKIGLLYVNEGQTTENQILANQSGSPRYHKFLQNLGTIVRVKDCVEEHIYSGGLDGTTDGEYSIVWRDQFTDVMFHVATMMPNLPSDKLFTNKKSHIGNDNVIIVYSDAKRSYDKDLISGQFNFVYIIIYPLEAGVYRVEVKKKQEVPDFGPFMLPQIVSEDSLIPLVRQTSLSGNLASYMVDNKREFVSNAEERLRQIKQIGSRFATEGEDFVELFAMRKTL